MSQWPLISFLVVTGIFVLTTLYVFSQAVAIRFRKDAVATTMMLYIVAAATIISFTLLYLVQ